MKMRTSVSRYALVPVAALTLLAVACERRVSLETRTFSVGHLTQSEVEELLTPYVYSDRADDPGTMSAIQGAVTIRETRDNLSRIERVLEEFDLPSPDVRLNFQLVEANGFTTTDPRINDVEGELRRLFDFQGYRLAAEATIVATDNSDITQGMRSSDGRLFEIHAFVERVEANTTTLHNATLQTNDGWDLSTSVTVRDGQTLVLGTSPTGDQRGTLFLTVRAETVTNDEDPS